ncbi:MAG: LysM peptidoglycan-binding domain-containing protein [Bacteroidota bacterium]
MMRYFLAAFLFFCLVTNQFVIAQQSAERSKVTETISGKKYYKHKVEKGQTLYSISKLYAVDQKIIETENPELKDGFKIGQILKVPFETTVATDKKETAVVADKSNYVKHIVEKEQTLYSISKKYNVSIEDIKKINPEAENGIRLGQELTIPVLQTTTVATKTTSTKTEETTTSKPTAVKTNKDIVRIEGKDYYLHLVEKGQTIYSIAKAYSIATEELIATNPQLIEGIQPGQNLKIEVITKNTTNKSTPVATESDNYFLHKVEKGQTVNAISTKYGCTNDELFSVNPDIVNGLKEGAFIKVPKKKAGSVSFNTSNATSYTKKRSANDVVNIGLFLPFYLARNDSGKVYKTTNEEETIFPKSIPAVEFYQGFLMALDSLNKTKVKTKIITFDIPTDPVGLPKFLEQPQLKDLDIIIGPFHSDDVTPVANFAKKNNIVLFAPFSQQSKALLGNPYLVKVTPSTPTIIEQSAEFIAQKFQDQNCIIIHNAMPKEKNAVQVFKTRLKELTKTDSIKEVVYKTSGIKGIQNNLKSDKKNILFFPSSDQAIVTDLINKLNTETKNEIVLFGLDNWTNYENLDIDLIQTINLHLPALGNVVYTSDTVKNFIGKFRAINKNEPSKYAFVGYDIGVYLSSLLATNENILLSLPKTKNTGLYVKFDFYQTSIDSGFENKGVYILNYKDYSLNVAN